ncbi:MAG: hypothetical protein ABI665_08480 [Vicinamibacterales bacterium]
MGEREGPDVVDAKARKPAPPKVEPPGPIQGPVEPGVDLQNRVGNAAVGQAIAERAPAADAGTADRANVSTIDDEDWLPDGGVSEASEMAQHMQRQYEHLAEVLPLSEWNRIVAAAEVRAERQANQSSSGQSAAYAIDVPLQALLAPAARFLDVDIWDTVFDLFHRADESPAAGILLRNEISRMWFTANGIDPRADAVTVSMIDADGLEAGPAQLAFTWRGKSLTDTLGSIELEWLESSYGGVMMVRPLRDAVADVSRDARELAEAAWLLRTREAIEPKLPDVIAKARSFKDARLAEVESYQQLVEECAGRAYPIDLRPRASSYVPGLYAYYYANASTLFELVGQIRDWRVGQIVNEQQHELSQAEVLELLQGETPYAKGEISYQGMQDLLAAERDRALLVMFVTVALSIATLGVGSAVASGIGLAEGTLGFAAVQMGTSFALTDVGAMGAEHIISSAIDIDDPVAQAVWKQGTHSVGDYFKAAGLGFLKGAALTLVLGGAMRGWQFYRGWQAVRAARAADLALAESQALTLAGPINEPPFVVISDTMDAVSGVRTWQLRTRQGELVTIAADEATGSGYIYHSGTGEIRRITGGQLEGSLQMLGEGPQVTGMWMRPAPLALQAASDHAEALAEIDRMIARGPGMVGPTIADLEAARDVLRTGLPVPEHLQTVLEGAVADYRASRMAALQGQGDSPALTGAALCGQCGEGRDITAASLASLLTGTGQVATIRRFQALEVFQNLGERHGFTIVSLEAMPGEAYLLDPTFAQFFEQRMFGSGGPLMSRFGEPWRREMEDYMLRELEPGRTSFTGNVLKTDPNATEFARDLMRDGFVRLTPENARNYVRAMGIPERNVDNMAARLLEGDRALVTEVVGGEATAGPISSIEEGPDVLDLRGVQEVTQDMIRQAEKAGDPTGVLDRLRALEARIEGMLAEPVPWTQEVHGPHYE